MILCVDCGNTLIKIGVFSENKLFTSFSIDSTSVRTADQYATIFKGFLKEIMIEGAIISSVVPSVTMSIYDAIFNLYNVKSLFINRSIKTGIRINIDYPNELGNDLLCGAVGAKEKYGYPCVVCDLGTASKMYVVDKNGDYIGGMITSGIGTSLQALVNKTSLLMQVPLIPPKKIINKNTKECIQSGIIYGQACMIKEYANQMEKELGYPLKKILTGGYSGLINDILDDFILDKNIILDGISYIYLKNIK